MTYFNRGGFGGGQGGRPSYNNRDSGRQEMHKATCEECGKDCEVPFRPNGSRPVYCSSCFEARGGGSSDRPQSRDYGRDNSRSFGRDSYSPNRGNRDERPASRQVDYSGDFAALNKRIDKVVELLYVLKQQNQGDDVVEVKKESTKKAPKKIVKKAKKKTLKV